MADEGTLATTAQVLLAIGSGADATQILEANTNIWIKFAEADMEAVLGNNPSIVSNYSSITAAMKQYLALVASHRAAFYAINNNQDSWDIDVAQSKLNVCDSVWQEFKRLADNKDFLADLGL